MQMRRRIAAALAVALLGSITVVPVSADAAGRPAWTKNCTALNKKYPHGVGKTSAKDLDSKGRPAKKPVKNFKKSNTLYKKAMKYNKGLDRDKDGIACEKR
ncbi:MAG TPA: excalibur calcium-binding domain-containing protein [Arachnia sp.]|nr:excalibur calcium-binding domain-containing protein [Propionibacteriaceae bacterium]HMS35576.1 excalibur calcium-binding domain-containing protein [Arachnia sp.]